MGEEGNWEHGGYGEMREEEMDEGERRKRGGKWDCVWREER